MLANERMGKQQLPDTSRPLAGKRIVVTRARSQASSLARRIEALGGEVIEFPTIAIQPPESYAALDAAIEKIHTYDWLVFTSVNGVEQFLARRGHLESAMTEFKGIQVAAIGPETAKRLDDAGIKSCLVPEQYQAEGLLEVLTPQAMRGKRVLIPRAAKARDILPETLRQWGAEVEVVEAYRAGIPATDAAPLKKMLQAQTIDFITFTSSSTVAHFVSLFEGRRLSEIAGRAAIACIGPITEKTVEDLGGYADVVAAEFTIAGLVSAIVDYLAQKQRVTGEATL